MKTSTSTSKTTMITIRAPIAAVGDTVYVLNYRMRPADWERAEVQAVTYRPAYVGKRHGKTYDVGDRWSYEVWIDRPLKEPKSRYGRVKGGGYRIMVGEEAIQPI